MANQADRYPLTLSTDQVAEEKEEEIYIQYRESNIIGVQGIGEKGLLGVVARLHPSLPWSLCWCKSIILKVIRLACWYFILDAKNLEVTKVPHCFCWDSNPRLSNSSRRIRKFHRRKKCFDSSANNDSFLSGIRFTDILKNSHFYSQYFSMSKLPP